MPEFPVTPTKRLCGGRAIRRQYWSGLAREFSTRTSPILAPLSRKRSRRLLTISGNPRTDTGFGPKQSCPGSGECSAGDTIMYP
jgi:hypothetical protein